MDILIVRHTKVVVDPNLCYGTADIPLSDTFLEEAKAIKKRLARWAPFDEVYSSPLSRALKLAKYLHNGVIIQDKRLREIEFGPWEMTPWKEIGLENFSSWVKGVKENGPPIETYKDVLERMKNFFTELLKKKPGERILITTHSGPMRCILALYSGMPISNIFQFRIAYGGILHLEYQRYSEDDYLLYPNILLPRMAITGINL